MSSPERLRRTNADAYGLIGERAEWNNVLEHYYWDRLEEAFRTAQTLGAGFGGGGIRLYRMVEAEHITRVRGQVVTVNDWLSIETIPDEVSDVADLHQGVLTACDAVAQKLGWQHSAKTLVSVLADEVDAPWTLGRYGYMVDKYPFDKICIPWASTKDPQALREVVAHEYAHVIALNLSEGKVPRWLDEAIAMSVESSDERQDYAFRSGQQPWLSPHDLEVAFGREQGDRTLWWAYQQSAVIGRFLLGKSGSRRIGDLLRGFANNSTWTELKIAVIGQPHEDEALREVYGMSVRELFELAKPRA
jgi:hypothetical protein